MTTRKRISVIALLMTVAAGVLSPAAEAAATRYITVSAQGVVKVVPDAVRISATATAVAATSKEALAATSKTATAVRAADSAGALVDSLVAAGGDNLQINGATPFVLDSTKSLEAARAAAVKSAKAKASSYAKLMGVKLGKVNYLVENSAPSNYTPVMAVAKAESDATVIDLGQQDVTIAVTVQWALL